MRIVDFLVYSRGAPDIVAAQPDDPGLDERHWTYMDRYAEQLTARGPTLGPERETWTGSMHLVDLPGPDAAREFVNHEPYHLAGAYAEHSVWAFENLLGRTMWEFCGPTGQPRFLVLAPDARPAPLADLAPALGQALILYGGLHTLEGRPSGVALAAQTPTRASLERLLGDLDGFAGAEVHDWEMGGRR